MRPVLSRHPFLFKLCRQLFAKLYTELVERIDTEEEAQNEGLVLVEGQKRAQ